MFTASTSVPSRLAYWAKTMAKRPQPTVSHFEIFTSFSSGASFPK